MLIILRKNTKYTNFGAFWGRRCSTPLRSENHQIYCQHVNKKSLCPLDTKRWIPVDGINTLAYGHKDIPGNV